MAEKRDVKYLNRDFDSFKNELVEFSKTYFPTTYTDFTPASTGMLFMEMASYVGDVLSFYLDNQVQETFIQYARQTENLYNLAYLLGYSPKVTTAATVEVEVFQTVPSKVSGTDYVPDYNYALQIAENTAITSTSNSSITFLMQDKIDFSYSNALDPTTVTIYEIDGSSNPSSYLLKKKRKALSATINTTTFTFGSPQRFQTVDLTANNIIGILDITDSDGNVWYEVPHLAQETIYDTIKNTNTNDPNYSSDTDVPYLLKLKQVQRRFAARFLNTTTLQIQFGAGTVADNDEEIMPNPDNVGIGLPFEKNKMTTAYSPTNFVFTDTYGISPSNTTLTVRYLTGGGVSANVPANDLTTINTSGITFINTGLTTATAQTTFDSVAVNNPKAAAGGGDGDDINELRQNSLGNFQNQLRTVTQDDYLIRALSMPSNLGAIAKAYATPQKLENLSMGEVPAVVDLYVLGYDSTKKLNTASTALKQNLKTYLSEYRIINDSVKIKDAFIINIGVDFDIIVLPNYNNNEVLQNCITALQNYFQIDKWQINQPIIMKDLNILLDKVEGVQTVQNVVIKNKTGNSIGYSDYAYDVKGATINNVVYPSIDPMIFELKYPNTDIQGRVVPL